jgi:molecular chaperone DnaK (HSP70)
MTNLPHTASASRTMPGSAPAGAATECRHCRQWEVGIDDGFCSFCGRSTLPLELAPEALILISKLAPAKEVVLRNESVRPMRVSIAQRDGEPFSALTFEPSGIVEIPGHGEVRLRVTVDAAQMPQRLRERTIQYVCVVDGDAAKQRTLSVTVRSGPRPSVLPPLLDFGNVAAGTAVERPLALANTGGISLRIRHVRGEGSPSLSVPGDPAGQVVAPGGKVTIPVVWLRELQEPSAEEGGAASVRIEFDNYPDPVVVPVRARTFRYLLEVKPTVIRIQQAVTKRAYPAALRLENNGTTDVEITAIEVDQPWIRVISRASSFTLLCAASSAERPKEPTTFARSVDLKVVCKAKGLTAGKHRAAVTIRPHGHDPLAVPVEIEIVQPKTCADYIGIDFGTTNSVVAVWNQNRHAIELVKDESSGRHLIPSVLVFDDAETYKIGQAARNEASLAPDRTVRSIKRVMGYETGRKFFDRPFSAGQIAALIIARLVQLAEQKVSNDTGHLYDIRKAIITVPANFYDLQIRDVLEACERAGLDTEDENIRRAAKATAELIGEAVNAGIILDEPSAAVLYYIDHLRRTRSKSDIAQVIERAKGLTLLVFDYGGGTLDVSVAGVTRVKGGGTGLRILANMGDNTIGGDTIDLILMKELLRRCKERVSDFDFDTTLVTCDFRDLEARADRDGWSPYVWRELLRIRADWKDLAEGAKIRIAEREQTVIDVVPTMMMGLAGDALVTASKGVKLEPLQAEKVDDLLQPVLAKCADLITASLALAGVDAGDVDYILHTGRQSLLPQIRKEVRTLFPKLGDDRDLLEEEHLKVCVAKGAALYGSMRNALVRPDARIHFLSEGRRLPHSYGVETFIDPLEPELDEVIPLGSSYPIEKTKEYPPEMIPPSGQLTLKFYQNTGVSKKIHGNPHITRLGQISIDTMDDGQPGCVVSFVVGANRTLNVFADGKPVTIERASLHEDESWMG